MIALERGTMMIMHIRKIVAALVFGCAFSGAAYCFDDWEVLQIYSNAGGSIQFVVLVFNSYNPKPATAMTSTASRLRMN